VQRHQKIQLIELLDEKHRRVEQNKFFHFKPYEWQKQFYAAGHTHKQRMLMAANRVGKTLSSCFELVCHLTGIYPDWWPGIRFAFPINAWALGVSGEQIRDVLQKEMLGTLSNEGFSGGGILPVNLVHDVVRSMTPRLAKDVRIQHICGSYSNLSFKSYSQGQHVLMGTSIDFALIDEEPEDDEIWPQVLTRLMMGNQGVGGQIVLSFTPENGNTELVEQFSDHLQRGQYLQNATWDDAPHLDEETKTEILASYPAYQRDMRSKGIPLRGEGLVFPVDDAVFTEEPLAHIPKFWPRIIGIDIGWDHPTALVWIAYDPENDVMHVYDCWRQSQVTPADVSGVIRPRADSWAPVAWPHDGLQHDKGSGQQLCELYRQQGVFMLQDKATFDDGSNGVEAGVFALLERMKSGRLKVATHLNEWFEEKRLYHRKRNKKTRDATPQIVKLKDDLLCATRYAMMMLRYAETQPTHEQYEPETVKENWY